METSEQSTLEEQLESLEISLATPLQRLFYLALLILLILFALLVTSAIGIFFSNDRQAIDIVEPANINQQANAPAQRTPEELAAAVTAAELIADLTLELQETELATGAAQRDLEEAQSQLEETRAQLADNRIQLTATQSLLSENQTRLVENQSELATARAQLAESQARFQTEREAQQQASSDDEELARLQLELINVREEGSARQQQYQLELADAQRLLSNALDQQNQLSDELVALREEIASNNRAVAPDNASAVGTDQPRAAETNAINAPDPVEEVAETVEAPNTDVVVSEELLRRASPEYPRRAASRNIEGSCEVEFIVAIDGSVRDPVVTESDPDDVFDDACLDAIEDFEYAPRTVNGVPVEATGVRVTFRFAFN